MGASPWLLAAVGELAVVVLLAVAMGVWAAGRYRAGRTRPAGWCDRCRAVLPRRRARRHRRDCRRAQVREAAAVEDLLSDLGLAPGPFELASDFGGAARAARRLRDHGTHSNGAAQRRWRIR